MAGALVAHRPADALQTLAILGATNLFVAMSYQAVRWYQRRRYHVGRRRRTGQSVLTMDATGIQFHQLDRTMPWSSLVSAELGPPDDQPKPPLAVRFRFREPDLDVAFEAEWLDQHPGVILATARRYAPQLLAQPADPGPVRR